MPRLALANMSFGFFVLFAAGAAGAFVATEITAGFLQDKSLLSSWWLELARSAHGHTNLFAILHLVFGLTMPYSPWSHRIKLAQTIGLGSGTLAMAAGLLVKGVLGPSTDVDLVSSAVGIMLCCALAALFSHGAGLALRAIGGQRSTKL